MSLVATTRRDKAVQLWAMMTDGPDFGHDTLTPEQATRRFQIWAEAWARPLIGDLIPELRDRGGPR